MAEPREYEKGKYVLQVLTGQYTKSGKQQRKSFYGKSAKECKRKYEEWSKRQGLNSDNKTFAEAYHYWLFNQKNVIDNVKASTLDRLHGIYTNYILPFPIGNKVLTEITDNDMIGYFDLLRNSRPSSTVKNVHRYFKQFFKYAMNKRLIKINVMDVIDVPKAKQSKDQFIFLDEKQQKEFIKALKGNDLELFILLGLFCGLRLGEILCLTYEDFDFKSGLITINKTLKRVATIQEDGSKIYSYKIQSPKTSSSERLVPFPSFLGSLIQKQHKTNMENKLKFGKDYYRPNFTEYFEDNDKYKNSTFLFCNSDGRPIDDKLPNRRLKSILKKANLNVDMHFHNLRSLFISNCIDKDINAKVVKEWAGHSDISVTLNWYARISKEKLIESSEIVNGVFSDLF